ncbi:TIGR03826 family flagellar region protein [Bacillus sp. SCS-151]|uniref:TIGR03826 family flagellar region protein n=1 Tax=Nanhaiella sioensis TaxID=3115293 RepID=UPI00397DCB00
MNELMNCPRCERLFVKHNMREVCDQCYKEEEEAFNKIYTYLRIKKNRSATIAQIVEDTEVAEEYIIKFIKKGRLSLKQFPNLGYPCKRCNDLIQEGELCKKCVAQLKNELATFEREEHRQEHMRKRERKSITYYSLYKDE